MTQKTFSNKTNPALNLFGFTLKKGIPMTAIASVLVLLISPLYIYNIIQQAFDRNYEILNYTYSLTKYVLPALSYGLAVAATGFGILLLFINFNFLYNKSASDVFHALPLTRAQLFITRFSASYLLSLIPLIVGYLGITLVSFRQNVVLDYSMMINGFLYTAFMIPFCLLVTMLFIVCTGCVFDAIVAFLAINIGVPICILPFGQIASEHIFGYGGSSIGTNAFVYGTPFGYSLKGLIDYMQEDIQWFSVIKVLIMLIIMALLCLAVIKIYNIRKCEKAGEPFAFGFIPYIISVIIAIIGFFIIASMFCLGLEIESIFFWVMGLIGALICGIVYNAIVNRGFKKIKNGVITGVIAVLLVGIVSLGITVDVFGIERYIPNQKNVEKAYLNFGGERFEVEGKDIGDIIDFQGDIITAHEQTRFDEKEYNNYTYFSVEYLMKGGKTVSRQYNELPIEIFEEQTEKVVRGAYADYIEKEYANNDKYDYFHIMCYAEKESFNCSITKAEYKQFIAAYVRDLRNFETEDIPREKEGGEYSLDMSNKEYDQNGYITTYIVGDDLEYVKYIKSLNLIARAQAEEVGIEGIK